jgi:S-DNA-T family DNA segregation ATPase FtsK/SpoIIIE
VALLVADPSGPAQNAAFAVLAAEAQIVADKGFLSRPWRVDPLPSAVSLSEAMGLGGRPESRLAALAGVGGDELSAWWVDLVDQGPAYVVTGTPESGRSTALLSMARSMAAQGTALIAITPRRSPLTELRDLPGVCVIDGASARAPADAGRDATNRLLAEPRGFNEGSLCVLVDDAELIDPDDVWLTEMASAAPGATALVIAGALESLRDGFRGFPLYAKRSGCGLLLSPRTHLDAAVFNANLARGAGFSGPPGRGYLFLRSQVAAVVQVPNR